MTSVQRCAHLAAALKALDAVAPLALAAKWDNTGLLVDATAPFAAGGSSSPAPYRVLMVDDQKLVGTLFRRLLAAHPEFVFEFCPDASAAVAVAGSSRPVGRSGRRAS